MKKSLSFFILSLFFCFGCNQTPHDNFEEVINEIGRKNIISIIPNSHYDNDSEIQRTDFIISEDKEVLKISVDTIIDPEGGFKMFKIVETNRSLKQQRSSRRLDKETPTGSGRRSGSSPGSPMSDCEFDCWDSCNEVVDIGAPIQNCVVFCMFMNCGWGEIK